MPTGLRPTKLWRRFCTETKVCGHSVKIPGPWECGAAVYRCLRRSCAQGVEENGQSRREKVAMKDKGMKNREYAEKKEYGRKFFFWGGTALCLAVAAFSLCLGNIHFSPAQLEGDMIHCPDDGISPQPEAVGQMLDGEQGVRHPAHLPPGALRQGPGGPAARWPRNGCP